jgi:hypothetical protein
MATKQRTSAKRPSKRAVSGTAKAAATNGGGRVRRVRMGRLDVEVHEPIEESPEERAAGIRRAATRIKTTAIIDTIHPGQEY